MKTKKEVIIRTIILLITLINSILLSVGKSPIPTNEGDLYETLSALALGGAAVWSWWKNNSFTPAAKEADVYLAEIKADSEDLS